MIDLTRTPWRRINLSERHDIWCLVDAVDYDWLLETNWNYGWHNRTPWKYYAKRNVGVARSTVYMHREILVRAKPKELELASTHHGDHANGQSLDNRRANLRWLTPLENRRNQRRGARPQTLEEIVRRLVAGLPMVDDVPFLERDADSACGIMRALAKPQCGRL